MNYIYIHIEMANTIFDINTTGKLPPVNQGMVRYHYEQLSSIRDPTGTSFSGGTIEYQWNISGDEYYVPARSYIRLRGRVTKANGDQLGVADFTAPAMDFVANLFSTGSLLLKNKELSKVDDFMAQISMLETRMSKSNNWMNNAGISLRWLDDELENRINDISVDGSNRTNLTRLGLGYDAITTIQIVAGVNNLGTAVFDLGVVVVLSTVWRIGDVLKVADTKEYTVISIDDGAQTLGLGGTTVAQAAGVTNFYRIRSSNLERQPRRVREFECIWIPPMSVNKLPTALPAGSYKLRLTPYSGSEFKIRSIESKGLVTKIASPAAGANFDVQVDSMFYYIATMLGPRIEDKTYFLDLDQTHLTTEDFTGMGDQQKTFSVSANTYAITVAFQSSSTGSDTRFNASRFKIEGNDDEKLTKIQVNYASQSKPDPQADPRFTDLRDYMDQRYADSILYSGMYFDDPESKTRWLSRGPYYHLPFPKDADDKSTRVIVRWAFTGATATGAKLLLFSHSKKMATIVIKGGQVQSVNLEDR